MIKYIKHVMTVEGIEILPIIAFLLFFVLFIALVTMVIYMDKKTEEHIKYLPLETSTSSNPEKISGNKM